ncbi:hypothetical protein [Candidatus Nitrosocosmicus hydrocola]|uniref:hypothetical protein n=1 Tax=Candidatus Nitrosocosmicus hydrocola TaxID=1826872 RepID=UPI0011E5E003|nr:hypothetical protein [Candidatus Nitrosocosmicus hydrocola]
MVTTSDYIQIISAVIYAGALLFTIITFRRTKRLDQVALSENIFKELRSLDLELSKVPFGSQYDDTRKQWYLRIFNTLNWLSFLINEKIIMDKKIIDHLKPDIIRYYEEIFLNNIQVDERDSKFYQEFIKLYMVMKK